MFTMEKFPSLEKFYTNAVGGVGDNYEVCRAAAAPASLAAPAGSKLSQLAAIPNALSSGQFCEDILERMSRTF